MLPVDNRKETIGRNKPLHAVNRLLQQGAVLHKSNVLFGEIISPPSADQRLEALSLAGGKNDPAEIGRLKLVGHALSPHQQN